MKKIQFVIALFAAAFVVSCSNSDVSGNNGKSCKTAEDCKDDSGSEYLCKQNICELKGSSNKTDVEYERVPIGGYCDLALECNDGTGGKYECVNKSCVKLVPKTNDTEDPEDPEVKEIVGKECSSASDCQGTGTTKYVCVENKCAKDSSQTPDNPDKPEEPAKPGCGNGTIDKDLGEVCDKTNLDGMKCSTLNEKYYGGILKCADDCQFDESGCLECDSTDLVNHGCAAGQKCVNSHCISDGNDPDKPQDPEQAKCGNGVLDSADGEVCDGSNLDGKSCKTYNEKYYSGTLKCAPTCMDFDDSMCEECDPMDAQKGCGEGKKCQDHHCVADTCGNGKKEDGEFCDGTDLGGKSCDDLVGYKGGTLKCFATCSFDSSECKIDFGVKTCSTTEDCSKGYKCIDNTCKAYVIECDPLDAVNHPCPSGKTCSKDYVCV